MIRTLQELNEENEKLLKMIKESLQVVNELSGYDKLCKLNNRIYALEEDTKRFLEALK